MTMQMIVTYQKTKSILSACSAAVGGSQFGMTATAVVSPPMIRAEQRQLKNGTPAHAGEPIAWRGYRAQLSAP